MTKSTMKTEGTDNSVLFLFSIHLSRRLVISQVLHRTQRAVGLDPLNAMLGSDGGNHVECVGHVLQRNYGGRYIQATICRLFYKKILILFSMSTISSTIIIWSISSAFLCLIFKGRNDLPESWYLGFKMAGST